MCIFLNFCEFHVLINTGVIQRTPVSAPYVGKVLFLKVQRTYRQIEWQAGKQTGGQTDAK